MQVTKGPHSPLLIAQGRVEGVGGRPDSLFEKK